MNINIYVIIILLAPLSLLTKGAIYSYINTTKEKSKIRRFSIIKTDNPLEFHEKNKYIAKAYYCIGTIITLFSTVFHLCYPNYKFKRAITMLLLMFLIDIFIEVLAKVKCQITDYDNKEHSDE